MLEKFRAMISAFEDLKDALEKEDIRIIGVSDSGLDASELRFQIGDGGADKLAALLGCTVSTGPFNEKYDRKQLVIDGLRVFELTSWLD